MSIFKKIVGDPNEKTVKKLEPIVGRVNELEKETEALSVEALATKTEEFKERLQKEETLDDILPEAFAVAREMAKRTLGQRHYDVQILGGIVLHQGKIAEMKTGEGKTLSSTSAIYLNALSGEGVHVITVNDYLAKRDAVWMGQVYAGLGLTVGVITNQGAHVYDEKYASQNTKEDPEELDEERDTLGAFKVEDEYLRPAERRDAYAADITYGTNNEFGFDYLRDNLAQKLEEKVQTRKMPDGSWRGHNFAIIDEIDSILIDEARTPLIISTPDTESTELYKTFAQVVPSLKEEKDYTVDHKLKTVSITEDGIEKIEKSLGVENLYDPAAGGGIRYVHNLEQSLKAHVIFAKDKDYVVREGEVIIVDEFTGRMMPGRRYSEGLHQAIEAKEGVSVQQESRTLASITFQNYFRMYDKLSGMTGTAITSAEEFDRVYELQIVVVPTNKTLVRKEMPDLVFKSEEGKYKALLRDIKERNEKGQPILIGTTSIEKNEYLGRLLQKEGIKHEVLNAKNHEREGSIVAQAGREGAVTVATNMAGRGVDIILGGNPPDVEAANRVKDAGGLHVLGTERHEARRIDDQLRGRAGRQGDPGSSQFYLSLEDELMRVFGGDRIQNIMERFQVPEDQPIENKIVSNAIESAQGKIEGMNFDTRKRLLDYDEVLNKHRETIYKKRDQVLAAEGDETKKVVEGYIEDHLKRMFDYHIGAEYKEQWNIKEISADIEGILPVEGDLAKKLTEVADSVKNPAEARAKVEEFVRGAISNAMRAREEQVGAETMRRAEKWLVLRSIDVLWMDHLDAMNYMRQDVRLRAYAQRDPLVEYKNEGINLYHTLLESIGTQIVTSLFKINIQHDHSHDHTAQRVAQNIVSNKQTTDNSKQSSEGSKPKNAENIGRNDPCPCGSGLKYKKCGLIDAPEHNKHEGSAGGSARIGG
ncbi:MAG: preprotein translocase subunit SecA [Candidatus Spechtbacterales bacterium]